MKRLPSTAIGLLNEVFNKIFPVVDESLNAWKGQADKIPDFELRKQALASIDSKKFHCQGGGVIALLAGEDFDEALRFIIAYQTISDYLDNLCDRSTSLDPNDFEMLHEAMKDALSPGSETKNYYMYRDEQNDGGYLAELVRTCQNTLRKMESYPLIQGRALELEALYTDLQIHKHVKEEDRIPRLMKWYNENKDKALGLSWFEFAAASGSTLGIFCLVSYGFSEQLDQTLVEDIVDSYFPYMQALHIMLDYYIDQEEDHAEGDLNFCSYYRDEVQMFERFHYFLIQAEKHVSQLPDSKFHEFIPKGLVGLYLNDGKVKQLRKKSNFSNKLLRKSGFTGQFLHYNIRMYYKMRYEG